jgi:hypothetical protein
MFLTLFALCSRIRWRSRPIHNEPIPHPIPMPITSPDNHRREVRS